MYDSSTMTVELPNEKRVTIKKLIEKTRKLNTCKIRDFAKCLGTIVSCCPAIKYSWLYTKNLERRKFLALESNNNNYDSIMSLNPYINDFDWWKSQIMVGENSIEPLEFILEIFSDASLTCWGIFCNNEKTNGHWDENERKANINILELKAAFFGLKCYAKDAVNCNILMRIDNTTAISYMNRMGGIQYKHLNDIAREIWQWCEKRNIYIFASYINTKDNIEADAESRKLEPETEYELANYAFERIVQVFGKPDIDLFASRINTKCHRYISWKKVPDSEAVDAFTLCRKREYFYAFPPFSIILKVLRKIKKDKSEGLLILPDWPRQPWYPLFRSMLSSEPIIFKPNNNLLISPNRGQHPLQKKLTMMCRKVSGRR